MYYIYVNNENKLNGAGIAHLSSDIEEIQNIEVTEEIYNNYISDPLRYAYEDGQIVLNSNYEQEKQLRERKELDKLTLTPADVERALYKAKNMDFEDLKSLITERLPNMDIKGLSIEFRAKDFYRGATLPDGTRLIDTVGLLLGYNSDDMDYLFKNKELPE